MKKLAAFVAAAALTLLCGCSAVNNNWILSINGNKIDKSEYMVYLYEQVKAFEETGGSDIWGADFDGVSAQDVAKQNAANSLLRAKLAVQEAPNLGVSSTPDEAAVEKDAKALYDEISADTLKRIDLDGVTLDMCKNIIRDGMVQKDVYGAVTDSYEINRQEFEDYLKEEYDKDIALYKNVTVKAIVIAKDPDAAPIEGKAPAIDEYSNTIKKEITLKGRERVDAAYKLLQQGEQFGQVQYDYSEDPDRREFVLNDDMYDENVRAKIYALNKGEYTDIIEYDGAYYIFYAKEAYQTDMTEISDELEARYIAEKKDEIYRAQNDSWVNAAEIKRNTPVWDGIEIKFSGEPQTEAASVAEQTVQQ